MPAPEPPLTPLPPPASSLAPGQRRGRWVAIITGALSIVIGVLYLALIVVLDARGPLQPPPPEALGFSAVAVEAGVAPSPAASAPPPA